MQHKQEVFNGLMVHIDLVDMKPTYTPDCENVNLSVRGELSSMEGIEKQVTSGFVGQVTAIHQLDDSNFALEGDELWLL